MAGEQAGLSEQLEQLWRDIEKSDDDGSAALAVLVAGHPIYYIEGKAAPWIFPPWGESTGAKKGGQILE